MYFRLWSSSAHGTANALAARIRDFIGVTLVEQFSWRSTERALENWRDAVQSCGVWVFKRSFRQDDVSGFCLASQEFPLMYVNNSQVKSRQVFTIFHELAHLLFDFSYVGRTNPEFYVNSLLGEDKAIEIACNAFAGEFLVPNADFQKQTIPGVPSDETLDDLASRYSVSSEVILRKYIQNGWVDQNFYNAKVQEWRQSRRPQENWRRSLCQPRHILGIQIRRTSLSRLLSG